MPTTETLLAAFTLQATPDELRRITYFIGECVARRKNTMLAQFHTRARQLRRAAEPGTWHRGFADSLTAYLDGYFAELEPTLQREELAREVADHVLWREILCVLRDEQLLNQVDLGQRVAARAPGIASSKSMISIALEDLRMRELVEYVPGKTDRRERFHSLTMRGRDLLAEPALASGVDHGVSVKASGESPSAASNASSFHGPPSAGATGERLPRRSPTRPLSVENDAGRSAPGEGERPRKSRASHPADG